MVSFTSVGKVAPPIPTIPIDLMSFRRSSELSDAVRTLLLTIKESLSKVGLDFKDEDIESLVGLEKPVIMVSRSK